MASAISSASRSAGSIGSFAFSTMLSHRHLNGFIITAIRKSGEKMSLSRADNVGHIVIGFLFAGSAGSLSDDKAGCAGWMVRPGRLRIAWSRVGRAVARRAPQMGA
jgi:hypothetical protein